jgi:serine/threonine protein kinase
MSRLSFNEVKKAREARRRAQPASSARHDLLTESRQAAGLKVTSKPPPLPELVEILPPDTLPLFYQSSFDLLNGKSLVHEGSVTIKEVRGRSGALVIIKQTALTFNKHGRVRERDRLEQFCREVRVLYHTGVLYNNNIVDVVGNQWDAVDDGQLLTLALECADFGNLAEFQSYYSTTWAHKKKICLGVAAGLSMLHDCGIFHGDLKPENILIFYGPIPQGEDEWDIADGFLPKLCDFGSSHFDIWTASGKDVTLYGATPPFTAPEYNFQGCLPSYLLSRLDIYVFGMLVWRIGLGGNVPLGILASELSKEGEIRELQNLKRFSDDQFLQLATKSISSIPVEDQSFYEKIFDSTLRFRPEDRARTVKEMHCLFDDEEEGSSAIIAVDYPRYLPSLDLNHGVFWTHCSHVSGSAPELLLKPMDLGIVGTDVCNAPFIITPSNDLSGSLE